MSEPSYHVDVEIDSAFATQADAHRLCAIALHTLAQASRTNMAQLTILVTSDDRIQELNRRFRGTDAPTDVLSFSVMGSDDPFITSPETVAYLGDVVVSYPRAVAQAAEAGHSILDELDLLVVHGVLHLLGWEDDTDEARAQMWTKQREIVSSRDKAP